MKFRLYENHVLVLLCATLVAGCSEQLSGGIVDDDGDLGLGASAIKAEKDAKDASKDGDDSDNDDSDNEESSKDSSGKDGSNDDASDTDTDDDDNSETGASNDDGGSESEESQTSGESSSTEDDNSDSTDETVNKKLRISFTTKTYDGRYGPNHVGAVWIEKKDGSFVRTVRQWGEIRQRHLVKWKAVSGSNTTDAATGATLYDHESHALSWDLRDTQKDVVPDGEYVLGIEFTEENSSFGAEDGPSLRVPFTLGAGGETLTPKDSSGYVDIEVVVP